MSSKKKENIFLWGIMLITAMTSFVVSCSTGDDDSHQQSTKASTEKQPVKSTDAGKIKTSGQGEWVFKLVPELSKLPKEAMQEAYRRRYRKLVPEEIGLHGGFAIDRREGKGEVYFGLANVGIIKLSGDLTKREVLPGTKKWLGDCNTHNASIFYKEDGTPMLSFPIDNDGKVVITDIKGKVHKTLYAPKHLEPYKKSTNGYRPTDTDYINGKLYVTTGYGSDHVFMADPITGKWHSEYFGGKGKEGGKFRTGHGISAIPSKNRIAIADRANARTQELDFDGKHKKTITLPGRCMPCDIEFHPQDASVAVVGCLRGPNHDGAKGAPIYIVKEGKVVSTILPKAELGVGLATHIHNANWKVINGENYILAQAWNPGHFFVLKQVKK